MKVAHLVAVPARSKPRSRRQWMALVREWRQSGLTANDFCRERQLVVRTFQRWSWVFAHRGVASVLRSSSDGERDQRGTLSRASEVSFVEVTDPTRPVGTPDRRTQGVTITSAAVEVVLSRDFVVRVHRGFDAETLRAVIRALEVVQPC